MKPLGRECVDIDTSGRCELITDARECERWCGRSCCVRRFVNSLAKQAAVYERPICDEGFFFC